MRLNRHTIFKNDYFYFETMCDNKLSTIRLFIATYQPAADESCTSFSERQICLPASELIKKNIAQLIANNVILEIILDDLIDGILEKDGLWYKSYDEYVKSDEFYYPTDIPYHTVTILDRICKNDGVWRYTPDEKWIDSKLSQIDNEADANKMLYEVRNWLYRYKE